MFTAGRNSNRQRLAAASAGLPLLLELPHIPCRCACCCGCHSRRASKRMPGHAGRNALCELHCCVDAGRHRPSAEGRPQRSCPAGVCERPARQEQPNMLVARAALLPAAACGVEQRVTSRGVDSAREFKGAPQIRASQDAPTDGYGAWGLQQVAGRSSEETAARSGGGGTRRSPPPDLAINRNRSHDSTHTEAAARGYKRPQAELPLPLALDQGVAGRAAGERG